MTRPTRIALTLLLMVLAVSCSKEDPLTTPEGGFEAASDALFSQNPELIWEVMSEDTHVLFIEGYNGLRSMEGMIEQLQASDREAAVQGTGVHLLDRLETPTDLFAYVLYWETLPTEQEYVEGMRIEDVSLDSSGELATITTAAEQEFEMVLDSDGVWRMRNPFHDTFASALRTIQENRANLEMAINLYGDSSENRRLLERLLGVTPAEAPAAEEGSGETATN